MKVCKKIPFFCNITNDMNLNDNNNNHDNYSQFIKFK